MAAAQAVVSAEAAVGAGVVAATEQALGLLGYCGGPGGAGDDEARPVDNTCWTIEHCALMTAVEERRVEEAAALLARGVSPNVRCLGLPLVALALAWLEDEEAAVRLQDLLLSRGMEWWYEKEQEDGSDPSNPAAPGALQWSILEGAVEEGRLAQLRAACEHPALQPRDADSHLHVSRACAQALMAAVAETSAEALEVLLAIPHRVAERLGERQAARLATGGEQPELLQPAWDREQETCQRMYAGLMHGSAARALAGELVSWLLLLRAGGCGKRPS